MTTRPRARLEQTLVGVAGEYFVAAELTSHGFLASITLRNSRGVDIIATDGRASRSVTIQVKTSTGGKAEWILTKKSESFQSKSHYYVFVILRGTGARPDYYVVPSAVVAKSITSSHRKWLSGSKANGSPRKDSSMRKFRDHEGRYREAWHLLARGSPSS